MIENKILLINPPERLRSEVLKKSNFIVYDKWFFFYFDNKKNKLTKISISKLPINYDKILFSKNDRKSILTMRPIWERWLRGSFDLDIFTNTALIDISKIRQFIKFSNVKKAVFYTAIPHHIDSSILSYCLSSLKITDLYTYKIAIGGQYLIVQGSVIFSKRKIPVFKNLKNDSKKYINEFISDLELGLPPRSNTKISWWKKNFYISLFLTLYVSLNTYKNNIFSPINRCCLSNHSFQRIISDLKSQKYFLNYYKKLEIKKSDFSKIKRSIIIAAHQQPEATTIPEGGEYTSHIDVILKIRSLGFKKDIYYKEHSASQMYFDKIVGPMGIGGYRSKQYLNDLLILNVKPLPFEESIVKNNLNWLITISGSIAIERSLLGLKTIVAGEPWFKGLPGTIPIDKISLNLLNTSPPAPTTQITKDSKKFLLKKLNGNCLPNFSSFKDNHSIVSHLNFLNQIL